MEQIKTAANTPATTNNQVAEKTQYKTALAKQTETYTNMMVSTFKDINIEYTVYQKICVANMIAKMNELLTKNSLNFKDIDGGNITTTLSRCAMLQLNIAAVPAECYLQLRNVQIGDVWKKEFEFGVEGNGNDAILKTYGVNVKDVKMAWLVREGDGFEYPSFNGLEITAPKWQPKSYTGKVIRVVYPVVKTDGTIDWLISEREDVAKNLKAHIANNLLGSKYKDVRSKILDKIADMSLEKLLSDESLKEYISPAWLNGSSREDMIIRKMKNNATKKYPKDFKNAFVAEAYESTYEDYDQYRQPTQMPDIDMTEKVGEEVDTNAGTKEIPVAPIRADEITGEINEAEPVEIKAEETPTPKEPVEQKRRPNF